MGKFRVARFVGLVLILSACRPAAQDHSKSEPRRPPATATLSFCAREQCLSPAVMTWRLRDRVGRLIIAAQRDPQMRPILAQYEARLHGEGRRAENVDRLVERINKYSSCNLLRYSDGGQMTFARELSRPDCNFLQNADFASVASDFIALANLALPEESAELRAEGQAFTDIGREILTLGALEDALFARGILRWQNGQLRVAHIGHPFEAENFADQLESYMKAAQDLGRHWSELTGAEATPCPEPACRRAIYRLAEAVSLRPQSDPSLRLSDSQNVAPSAYALSYFSQRFAGNGDVRLALGLDMRSDWIWRPEQMQSRLLPEGNVLVFQQLMRDVGMRFSLADWHQQSEYPYVVPLFLAFQEAWGVYDYLRQLPQQPTVAQIREIRFEPYRPVMVDFTPTGAGWRLNLHVLRAAQELGSIEATRQRLFDQLAISVSQAKLIQ